MNLIRFKSVFALCWFFLVFRYGQVTATTPSILMDDNGYCGFSDAEEDLCSAYCYKSVKPPLSYIMELKEQMKAKAEEHSEREKENKILRQRLLELSDFREQFKALNQKIEELHKTNNINREFYEQIYNNKKTEEDMKHKAKELNECVANRDSLKKEIELERKNRIEMEEKHKINVDNLKKERDSEINEFGLKSIKESSIYKAKEEIFNNEIQELKSQVSSYKKQLEETQNQLTDKNILVESNSLKMKAFEKDLDKCNEKLPKTSCKGLPSGIHRIELPGLDPFSALCNGDIDGGGWIVVQKKNFYSLEDFYRNWTEYREGFGKLGGEFLLGLESLHRITNSERYELYIEMEYLNKKVEIARYDNFRIGNENEKYELQSIGNFTGSDFDYLNLSLGGKFSTYDQDNDLEDDKHMAKVYARSWWYSRDNGVNPNGRYFKSGIKKEGSINWSYEYLNSVQMLIRPFQLK